MGKGLAGPCLFQNFDRFLETTNAVFLLDPKRPKIRILITDSNSECGAPARHCFQGDDVFSDPQWMIQRQQ